MIEDLIEVIKEQEKVYLKVLEDAGSAYAKEYAHGKVDAAKEILAILCMF